MGGLHIPITATDNNVSSKLDQVSRKIDELASKAQASNNTMIDSNSKLGASFNALASKVGASVAAIASVQKLNEIRQTITQVRGEFEQLEISLSTILGSKAEADKLMAQVVDFAAKTPFDMKGVASGVKQLLAYGSTADSVIDEMRMLGDIASGLSIPLGDMVYLFGTTRTQGRMFTQDLRQFMGRGIPLAEELAKQFGVTKAAVSNLVTDGKVGFNEMYKALQAMTSEGGKFYNLMDSQSRSILGMQSNADDARDQMYNEIGKLLQGVTAKGIEAQNYLYENYEKVGGVLLELVGTYGVYKAVLITINALHKAQRVILKEAVLQKKLASMANVTLSNSEAIAAARTSLLNKSMKGLLTTLKATGKAMLSNPYVLAAAAVAGLAYGIYKLVTAKSAEEKAIEATNKQLKEYDEGIEKRLNNANDLISAMKDENRSSSERVASMRKLAQQYPQLLEKYGEEALMLMDIRDLKREIVGIESTNKKSTLTADIQKYQAIIDKLKSNEGKVSSLSKDERNMLDDLGLRQRFDSYRGTYFYNEKDLRAITKAMSELQKKYNDILSAEQQEKFSAKPIEERLKIYEDRAEKARKKVQELNAEIDKLGSKQPKGTPLADADGYKMPSFSSVGDLVQMQAQRDAQIKAAEDAEKNAEALRKKQEEEKKKAAEDALKAQQKAQEDINKKLLQSDNEREKARVQEQIDLLQYSTKAEKDKEEELHNLRKELLQIEQAIALETLDLEYKKYKAIFEAAGKDTTQLDEAYAKLEQNTVDSFKQKSDKEDADYDKKKKDRQEQELDDEIAYNEQYGNIMEQRAAIVQKYARLIEKAENDAQKKTLEKERDRKLREFDSKNSGEYYQMFVNADVATAKQIERAIDLIRKKMQDLLKGGVKPWSEEMQNLKEQYDALIQAQESPLTEGIGTADIIDIVETTSKIKSLKDALTTETDEGKKAQINLALEQLDNKLAKNKLYVALNYTAQAISKIGSSLAELGQASGDADLEAIGEGLKSIGNVLTSTAQGASSGGWIGAIIGFVTSALTEVSNRIFEEIALNKRLADNVDKVTEAVNKLKYTLDSADFNTIFGITDYVSKMEEAAKIYKDAQKDYNNALNSYSGIGGNNPVLNELRKKMFERTYGVEGDALKSIQVDKGKDGSDNLWNISQSEGWGIWDENGEFNAEAAQAFLNSTDPESISDASRQLLQSAIDSQEALKEMEKIFDDIASQLFGQLGSGLSDAIINATETGSDAFRDFGNVAGDVVKQIGRMWLENMIYEELFSDYNEEIKNALKNQDSSKLVELTDEMLDNAQELIPGFMEWYQNFKKQAEDIGIDSSSAAQEATAKGFQSMSQETGDELNGRFTDIQAKSGMIAIGVNSLVQINNSIFQNTSAMLVRLGEMFGIQNLQLKELNTISKNTDYLITIAEDISALRKSVRDINGE